MQFQKKEKRQTTVRFDSHHVRLRTGEVQRKNRQLYVPLDRQARKTLYHIRCNIGRSPGAGGTDSC